MKKIVALFLTGALALALLCGCGAPKPNVTDGQIKTAADLKILAQKPEGEYTLAADIDLGGATWEPVQSFAGTLDGTWGGAFCHTVRNFTVEAKTAEETVGFFRELTGTVSHIRFENVTLILPDDFSGNAGVLAGICTGAPDSVKISGASVRGGAGKTLGVLAGSCTGDIRNCYADGTVDVTAAGEAKIGGLAGTAAQIVGSESRTDMTCRTSGENVRIGGIAGQASTLSKPNYGGNIRVDAASGTAFAAPLAGELTGEVKTGYACARSFETSGNVTKGAYIAKGEGAVTDCVTRDTADLAIPEKELALRQKAVDYMYAQCTIPWMPEADIHYEDDCKTGHIQDYHKGQWYFGLPYTHLCASLEKFEYYLDENGVLKKDAPELKNIGNDCADAVFWALQQVSVSPTYLSTDGMIAENGLIPVGTWEVRKNTAGQNSSKETCAYNGEQVMYEAYSQMKMGDVLALGPGGHARMAAENAYIFRNEDGSIDPEKSYILIHEQGAYPNEKLQETHSTCRIGYKQTFATLFKNKYVPVTVPEYAAGEPAVQTFKPEREIGTYKDLCRSTLIGNARVAAAYLVIREGEKTVLERAVFPTYINKHLTAFEMGTLASTKDIDELKDGKTYRATVYINGKEQKNIAADITFEK